VLEVVVWDWSLHVHLFNDEVDDSLGFDRMRRHVFDGIGTELDRPLDDATAGFHITEDISEWVLRDHSYVEGIEVVAKLSGCYQDRVEQFLNLRVSSFGLVQDFADEVNWALDFVRMSSLFSLDNNSCANYPIGRRDVD
jgi:hypothetical protein